MSSTLKDVSPPPPPPKLVVAALLLREMAGGPLAGGRAARQEALITRRRAGGPLGGLWEFPGGKLEPGESPDDALRRELREELGIEVEVGRIFDVVYHRYPTFTVLILLYRCRLRSGTPRPLEVDEVRWASLADLGGYEFLPADVPLVARLEAEGAASSEDSPASGPVDP